MIKVRKTVTTREVKTITLTEEDLKTTLREYYKLKPNAEVDFDIRQGGGFLAGCTIIEESSTTKEVPNGEG